MLRSIITVLFMLFYFLSWTQGVMGAEMLKSYEYPYLEIEVWLWREGPSKPYILFDWGDNTGLDTIELYGVHPLDTGIVVDSYYTFHEYDTTGVFILGFQDSFLVPGIKNITNSSTRILSHYDTVSFVTEQALNSSPRFISQPAYFSVRENGTLAHTIYVQDDDLLIDDYVAYWHPYPAEGYSEPLASNGFYVVESLMVWDRPIETGRYALGMNIRETRNDVFQTSTLRSMLIDVSEDFIVSSNEMGIQQLLALYPNPTSANATLEYGGLSGQTHLQITNPQGQLLLQRVLNGTAQLQRKTIDVSTWPAGIYWIELRNAQGQVTKKLVVE